jgi:peptidoglycan/xylan/chitin deacetylase (PgdA/CDA1 family)
MRASTLMYHDVEWGDGRASGFEGDGPSVYAVTAEQFRAQLDGVAGAVAAPALRGEALLDGAGFGDPWLLTFDDGGASGVAAGEELARRGWPAHFFVVTSLIGQPGFMDWDDLRALAAQGHAIGSHSHSHPSLMSACSPAELREEWSRSVALLSEAIGEPVRTASVPGGYYSRAVGEAAAAAGIRVLFTSDPVRAVRSIGDCLLVGRYAIRRDTADADVVAAAAGRAAPWLRQRASWALRGAAKKLAGRRYNQLRAALLARRGG